MKEEGIIEGSITIEDPGTFLKQNKTILYSTWLQKTGYSTLG